MSDVVTGRPTTPAGVADSSSQQQQQQQQYGRAKLVPCFGSFPGPGSRLGPLFCLGRLGRGTFCSIHRCIDLRNKNMVAAKVELMDFANSGVLDGEATTLHYLDSSMPPHTIPAYNGHYKSDEASAIAMEYLQGEDMHQLRYRQQRRLLRLEDAVYLTADVMLPLLKEMHEVGMVHRDVKPSNLVRVGTDESNKDFMLVDFGLSKSIVVPKISNYANTEQPWKGKTWSIPPNATQEGCLRKERPTAEFRGTSMYASLRVHQLKDYGRRDDIWSLLYVFCDLVSGGLPWMQFAANRERQECQLLKERVQDGNETDLMLMGEDYYISLYNQEVAKRNSEQDIPPLAEPLEMAKDEKKLELLRTAFDHVSQLSFYDKPDYDLIHKCIKGFLDTKTGIEVVVPLNWYNAAASAKKKPSAKKFNAIPTFEFIDTENTDLERLLDEAETERKNQTDIGEQSKPLTNEERDMARLPIPLQFRVAQMEYNTRYSKNVQPHVALRDWIYCVLWLIYGTWDSARFEKGNHRTNQDGYRREFYLKLLEKCQKSAKAFDNFRDRLYFYGNETKRRKITAMYKGVEESPLVLFSKAMFGLQLAIERERQKNFAPPPALSFGSGVGEAARAF